METISIDRVSEARNLCEQGKWGELLSFVLAWVAESSSDPKAFFYQGIALSSLGRFLEADTSYRQSLKLDASDVKVWNNLAVLCFDGLKRPAEGAQCLAQVLKLDPGNKVGWSNLACINGRLGRHQYALECAERALALDPQMVEAQLYRARAAQVLGQMHIVQQVTEALAKVPVERFRRAR